MKDFARHVLERTGYLVQGGAPAEGLILPDAILESAGDAARLGPIFTQDDASLGADAVFRVGTSPVILFKSADATDEREIEWHRTAWNFGVAPLLWVTTPQYVRLYNAYQPPEEYAKRSPLIAEFAIGDALVSAMTQIEEACGRRHVAMGSFWKSGLARDIDRRTRIDNVLLGELGELLRTLVKRGLKPSLAQKLVGRCVFFQYLVHRGYLTAAELESHFGAPNLHSILSDLDKAYSLFRWIRATFNGDLFPIEDEASERAQLSESEDPIDPLADFFGHFSIVDGQGRLFPFRFDAIPVELISSIYEKFVHMSETDGSPKAGVHYTPINLVDLVLDPVFEGLEPGARVLDPACGSGVFLVESLRRLVWLQARHSPLTRKLIRQTLLQQIRGVDISPAALSVAAFSLYLALLELDPDPPRGIDGLSCLKFDPLMDKVLFATSTFEPGLETRLFPNGHDQRFEVIVGNPPWTYSADEKALDRELARAFDDEDAADEELAASDITRSLASDPPGQRSGTTYARLKGLPIPPRSTDWPFLWRCRELGGPDTRIALVLKATPFFSQAPATHAARDAILRSFENVTLVNLSQLRTSRLFQEYEGVTGDGSQKKRAAGPAMLFLSNCLPVDKGSVAVLNFPWSSSFNRTGVFELPSDPPKLLDLARLQSQPGLIKAATFGTSRDAWFLERLSRNPRLASFQAWCVAANVPAGRGLRAGSGMDAAHLRGLPHVTARDLKKGRIAIDLPIFNDEEVNRSREPALFKGPVVLLPEGSLTAAPLYGRYTAAVDGRDLAYNSSFVGVSFHDKPATLGRAFAAMMHSRFVAHQLAFTAGTLGVKQTKVEVVDLEALYLPLFEKLSEGYIAALAGAYDRLAGNEDADDVREAAARIDEIIENLAGLNEDDRSLLADSDRRTRAIFFETETARRAMEAEPNEAELRLYAHNLCSAFNAFATEPKDERLFPDRYARLTHDVVVLRFGLTQGKPAHDTALTLGTMVEMSDAPLEFLGGSELPYLKPSKSLRLYVGSFAYVLKPAQYRCFSPAAGQTDADQIVSDLMNPAFPAAEYGAA
ncbi:MAG: N-6 DNA methylase [Aurantimonas endophytica]|uniref:HsdM family class I SAM-dependent methyltransferase n=1 Tax=Aurantimonas endophytica TaxID=1522175 RepID=UPI0030032481